MKFNYLYFILLISFFSNSYTYTQELSELQNQILLLQTRLSDLDKKLESFGQAAPLPTTKPASPIQQQKIDFISCFLWSIIHYGKNLMQIPT